MYPYNHKEICFNMPHELIKTLTSQRFVNLDNEKRLQEEIEFFLNMKRFDFKREHRVGVADIFDFFFPAAGIVLEIKLKGGKKDIYRQLERYSGLDCCQTIVLFTNVTMAFHEMLNNKPVYIIKPSRQWL